MAVDKKLQVFYSSDAWINFRLGLIATRGNKDEITGEIIANAKDIVGHHKTELTVDNYKDTTISLNPANVILVSRHTHDTICHDRFGHKATHEIIIVYGAPLSGKHTLVNQLLSSGDMIIDIDMLYQAISGLTMYDKPNNLYSNAVGIYNKLIDDVRMRYGKWQDCYIIGGLSDRFKREKLVKDLGARLLYCECSKDECIRRAYNDDMRKGNVDEWIGYINKWFDEYRE